ncbi:hypothetical protein [Bradyrhizobium mercantei]|uniref:hypothetical protein n=1 Tax=Bradyrhizobium mercantei TaxID=1904807 RepID=UPI00097746CE|nr:hypothetical protein [Bradyrhizobium mercantei]
MYAMICQASVKERRAGLIWINKAVRFFFTRWFFAAAPFGKLLAHTAIAGEGEVVTLNGHVGRYSQKLAAVAAPTGNRRIRVNAQSWERRHTTECLTQIKLLDR